MLKGTVQGDIVPSVIFSYKSIPQLNLNPKDVTIYIPDRNKTESAGLLGVLQRGINQLHSIRSSSTGYRECD